MIITSKDSTILEKFTSEVIDKASKHEVMNQLKIRADQLKLEVQLECQQNILKWLSERVHVVRVQRHGIDMK